ncbi:MAG: HIT family protein [Phycisphaeraceae bacterium]
MPTRNLWAPWRIDYIKGLDPAANPTGDAADKGDTAHSGKPSTGCFLCDLADPDLPLEKWPDALLLHRGQRCMILLNRYPYTNGHLLIAPHEHVGDLCDMSDPQRGELMDLTNHACRALQLAMNPQGMNVGMNIGRCAGAGVPGHAHMHVVPRWHGDANFMQTLGGVRVIPQSLEHSYTQLKDALARLD